MNKNKIINDPVYGFITIPYPILYDIVEHPYFQRLRRIQQLGLTNYVYPGAQHTRFAHALGAMHLMNRTLEVLRSKGIAISKEEEIGALAAILLHDVGHGPYSHTLEHTILEVHHEELSKMIMYHLNDELNGQLDLAIKIFSGNYDRGFFHQLVASQLDLDRMDYLTRDSFFTGVSEGVIGYNRILNMLTVVDDELVVEEKGIYSIEKYLTARRIMYWQTYLHKTVLATEKMLVSLLKRFKSKFEDYNDWLITPYFRRILEARTQADVDLGDFVKLDDYDIMLLVKSLVGHPDSVLHILSDGIINRRLFKTILQDSQIKDEKLDRINVQIQHSLNLTAEESSYLLLSGTESNLAYTLHKDHIKILGKDGEIRTFPEVLGTGVNSQRFAKHYLCYPKYM
ncbi:MAG: HD domain-containing protein [Bacteroidia bacterium]|nr:HD domain-containing protein [Bacteroidia bacterium]